MACGEMGNGVVGGGVLGLPRVENRRHALPPSRGGTCKKRGTKNSKLGKAVIGVRAAPAPEATGAGRDARNKQDGATFV